jgi:hypothetical protein
MQADKSYASLDAAADDSSLVLYRDPSRASAQSRGSVMSGTNLQKLVLKLQCDCNSRPQPSVSTRLCRRRSSDGPCQHAPRGLHTVKLTAYALVLYMQVLMSRAIPSLLR